MSDVMYENVGVPADGAEAPPDKKSRKPAFGEAKIRKPLTGGKPSKDKAAKKVRAEKAANPPKPAHDPTKMVQPCSVCGHVRKFVEYRTRPITRRDGSQVDAKWPHYEPCPNINNPELHPHYHKGRGQIEVVNSPLRLKIGRNPDVEVMLFQLTKGRSLASAMDQIEASCQQRLDGSPKTLYVPEGDYQARSAEVDLPEHLVVKPLEGFTPDYQYVM